jgi:hypothetical protein
MKNYAEAASFIKSVDPKGTKKWSSQRESMGNTYWETFKCDGIPIHEITNETGRVTVNQLYFPKESHDQNHTN